MFLVSKHFHTNVFDFVFTWMPAASSQLRKDHNALEHEFRAEHLAVLANYVNPLASVNRRNVSRRDRLAVDATIGREELRLKLKYSKLAAAINSKYR
jgi:hypothetical protein